jgi:hypothetical protein
MSAGIRQAVPVTLTTKVNVESLVVYRERLKAESTDGLATSYSVDFRPDAIIFGKRGVERRRLITGQQLVEMMLHGLVDRSPEDEARRHGRFWQAQDIKKMMP